MRLALTTRMAFLAVLVLCFACTPISQPDRDAASELTDWQPPAVGDPFPPFELQDASGKLVNNASLAGRPAVIAFVSLATDGSSPGSQIIMERMVELPARVPTTSPRLLAIRLAPTDGQAPPPIEVLGGTSDSIVDLAASLGVMFDRAEGAGLHGYATTVLDPEGRIVVILRGHSEWDAARLAAAVAAAAGH